MAEEDKELYPLDIKKKIMNKFIKVLHKLIHHQLNFEVQNLNQGNKSIGTKDYYITGRANPISCAVGLR